jgi:phage terminase large subunit GpA-like protein
MTADAYTHIRNWPKGRAWATKGMPKDVGGAKISHKVLDKMPTRGGSIPIPGGLVLWRINVSQMKEDLFWRLQRAPEEAQAARFHADTEWAFFRQITAEERRLNRQGQYEWVQIRRDNHYLDACVIAHACADPQWAGGLRGIASQGQEKKQEGEKPSAGTAPWLGGRNQGWFRR